VRVHSYNNLYRLVLKITGIGNVMRSNTELIDMSDAQMQREIYPLYIIHDNENIKSTESLVVCRQALC
jgi:hypothetical protein